MSKSFEQAIGELPAPVAAFFRKLSEHPEYECAALTMQMTVSFRGEKVGGFNRQTGVWYISKVFVRNNGGADPAESRGFRHVVKDEHHQYWAKRGDGSLEAFRDSVSEMTGASMFEDQTVSEQEGGCLCGRLRYSVKSPPMRLTICHCRFCQRATGSGYLVEPIFETASFSVISGQPKVYHHRSTGSGKIVYIHFCENCGTKLFMTFERFPNVGVFGGTLDDPNWFERSPENSKHIFLSVAQRGTVIPAGFNCFEEHAMTNEGQAIQPHVYDEPRVIGKR